MVYFIKNSTYHLQVYLLTLNYVQNTLNWYYFSFFINMQWTFIVLYKLPVLKGVQYASMWNLNISVLSPSLSRAIGPKYDTMMRRWRKWWWQYLKKQIVWIIILSTYSIFNLMRKGLTAFGIVWIATVLFQAVLDIELWHLYSA